MAGEIREILWNDGEGLEPADLNNAQRFLRAQLWDAAFSQRIRAFGEEYNVDANSAHLYSYGGGAVRKHASARVVTNDEGLIAMHGAAGGFGLGFTGADAQVLSYYLAANELQTTLDVGDANPRIDLICVKLEHIDNDAADQESRDFKDATTAALSTTTPVKRRKVRLTKQVVKGTPAGSPVEPAVPAGFVKWAAVEVGALHNAVFDVTSLRDYRHPAGLRQYVTYTMGNGPGVNLPGDASGWAAGVAPSTGEIWVASSGKVCRVFPIADSIANGRLLRVSIAGLLTACTVQLIRRYHDPIGGAATDTVLATLTSSFSGGGTQLYTHTFAETEAFWLNGFRAGIAALRDPNAVPDDARLTTLGLKFTTTGAGTQQLRFVRWDVAAL